MLTFPRTNNKKNVLLHKNQAPGIMLQNSRQVLQLLDPRTLTLDWALISPSQFYQGALTNYIDKVRWYWEQFCPLFIPSWHLCRNFFTVQHTVDIANTTLSSQCSLSKPPDKIETEIRAHSRSCSTWQLFCNIMRGALIL